MGAGLFRFGIGETGAGRGEGSGISVERFAASAASAGVSEGWLGGGWRRFAIGLRAPQPEKIMHRTQSAERRECESTRECDNRLCPLFGNAKPKVFESAPAENGSNEIFKELPVS